MKLVPSNVSASPCDRSLLPDRDTLDRVRKLGETFPAARLVSVAVARAADLDRRADPSGKTHVWLALESLQVTGSFKVRGALFAMSRLRSRDRNVRIVAASAGNHGAGVAYASRILKMPATVVVPLTTPRAKRDRIVEYGAEIVLSPLPGYDGAEAHARALADKTGAHFLSPYDDVDVVAGNGGSLGFEIVRALGRIPDRVIAPLGGGGLATGLACAFAREEDGGSRATPQPGQHQAESSPQTRVWGAQSEASPAMMMSLVLGEAVRELSCVGTLAEGLEGGISLSGFARARQAIGGVLVCSEDEIAESMAYAHRELGREIEGSAAVALVPVRAGLPEALSGGDLVVVLTGRNVDRERMDQVLDRAAR